AARGAARPEPLGPPRGPGPRRPDRGRAKALEMPERGVTRSAGDVDQEGDARGEDRRGHQRTRHQRRVSMRRDDDRGAEPGEPEHRLEEGSETDGESEVARQELDEREAVAPPCGALRLSRVSPVLEVPTVLLRSLPERRNEPAAVDPREVDSQC